MLQTVTINQNRDFRRIYRLSESNVHPVLVTYKVKNRLGFSRVGITATKKIGKAHARHRARRIIREAYRLLEPQLSPGWDYVFVARTRTAFCPMQEVKKAMNKALEPCMRKPVKQDG
jgi:ribonuclease P protein component